MGFRVQGMTVTPLDGGEPYTVESEAFVQFTALELPEVVGFGFDPGQPMGFAETISMEVEIPLSPAGRAWFRALWEALALMEELAALEVWEGEGGSCRE
jgi:hypothetical protein